MTFALARPAPARIAYGAPAGLVALLALTLALPHPLLWLLAGLAAALSAALVGAAVLLAPPWRRFLDGPAAPTAFIGS
jgi:hypothetical protein